MSEQVAIDQNLKTPVVTVSVMSDDPAFAVYFLDRLTTTANAVLRQRALLRVNDWIRDLMFESPAASDRPVTPVPAKTLALALVRGFAAGLKLVLVAGRREIVVSADV